MVNGRVLQLLSNFQRNEAINTVCELSAGYLTGRARFYSALRYLLFPGLRSLPARSSPL